MINYLLLFLVGFLLSLALTPAVRWLAFRVKALDMPGERKVHTKPVPRLGGLGVFVAFHVGLLLGFGPLPDLAFYLRDFAHQWLVHLLPAVAVIVIVGIADDIRPLRPVIRLLGQALAALVAVQAGCVINLLDLPWIGKVQLGMWAAPVTIFWILALTNAFNLIDRLDGLSCGIGLISTLTLGAAALLRQDSALVLVCTLLAGGLAGFLRHNFHPARIFMGDTGSLFLGFTLALLSVTASHKTTASLSVLVPVLAFGVPLLDTVLSVLRRSLRDRGAFEADRRQIHHRLLDLGFSHPRAVLVLYAVSLALAALTLWLVAQRNLHLGLIFVAVGVTTMLAVRRLRHRELEFLRNGSFLAVSLSPLLGYEFFQKPIDLLLTALSLYLANVFSHGWVLSPEVKDSLRASVALIVMVKFFVLQLNGLYQIRWQYAGLADLLRGLRAVVVGSIVTTLVLWLVNRPGFTASVVALDFYLTATLLLGVRMSLRLLEHYAQTDATDKERVFIYGTGGFADMLVRHLMSEGKMAPVGFIHDGSEQRGKTIHGIPILGSLSVLPTAAREHSVATLLIADPNLPAEQRDAVRAQCRQAGVELQQFRVSLE